MNRKTTESIGWTIAAALCVMLFYGVHSPARAQMPEGVAPTEMPVDCGDHVCVVPKAHLFSLLSANNKMEKALEERAKTPPRCATVDVVPDKPKVEIKLDPKTRRSS